MFKVERSSRGGAPLFQPYHILKALWVLSIEQCLSRGELSRRLGIGEGSTRKLLAHLADHDLARISKQGVELTTNGSGLVETLGLKAAPIDAASLTVGKVDFGVRLSGLSGKVRHGLEQRDEAIKIGAEGATTLVYLSDELRLPDGFDIEGAEPDISATLAETFDLLEGDVLVLGTAGTMEKAEDGAFAGAVWMLIEMNRKE